MQEGRAELYGSLAATGKGHLTDKAIREVFSENGIETDIFWFPDEFKPFHPNALTITELSPGNASETYYSVGGGKVVQEGERTEKGEDPYPDEEVGTMAKLLKFCDDNGYQIWETALEFEGEEILDYMSEVWEVMKEAIRRGLEAEGVLPGGLRLQRKACQAYAKAKDFTGSMGTSAHAFAFALAVSEENAGGGKIVTAPTCGSCGVLPGVLYHLVREYELPEIRVLRALLTAGMVGNLVKTNGSISGAEGITTGIRIKTGRKEAEGDTVITHNGISGPVVLNMSRNVLDGDEITISFSDVDIKELRIREPKKLVRNAIDLPERLIRTLIGNLADKKIGNLSKDDERKIEENITAFRTRAWPVKQQAMTEAGGAILSEFNPVTMESKLVPGLYAAGDVLDVDADTGGYSLTWAFATAWCISRALML